MWRRVAGSGCHSDDRKRNAQVRNDVVARRAPPLLWICGACLRLTVLAVPPVIATIQRDFALSGTEVGLLSGIPILVFAIFAAPGSFVVVRFGVRGALLVGLVTAAVGTLLRTACSNVWELYLASAVMSIGIAVMQPALPAAVREWLPARATFGTAVYTNGLILGEIIPVATMLPFVLPLLGGDWRLGLGVWSIPLIATAVAVALFAPGVPAHVVAKRPASLLPQLGSRLNWRIGLTLGSVISVYFCLNGFLPACLSANGRQDLIGEGLTALNSGQVPASFLLVLVADRLQGKRWPFLLLGAVCVVCIIGIMLSAGVWTVVWAFIASCALGAALPLGFALAPQLCDNPDDVARTSAAGLAIAYGFAMLVSFISGFAWDFAGHPAAALIPILLGSLPVFVATPNFVRAATTLLPGEAHLSKAD
jgi:CP family cyanate transporter-like MFS transporter